MKSALAVGDAVGTTVEFRACGQFEPLTDMVGGGPFGLEPGISAAPAAASTLGIPWPLLCDATSLLMNHSRGRLTRRGLGTAPSCAWRPFRCSSSQMNGPSSNSRTRRTASLHARSLAGVQHGLPPGPCRCGANRERRGCRRGRAGSPTTVLRLRAGIGARWSLLSFLGSSQLPPMVPQGSGQSPGQLLQSNS